MDVQLTPDDIDGATLGGRKPKDLRIPELKFWLQCRKIKTSRLKTKAEFVARVTEIIAEGKDGDVVDPTAEQLYVQRKKRKLDLSSSSQDATHDATPSTSSSMPCDIQLPSDGWSKDISSLPDFSEIDLQSYSKKSGKNAVAANGIVKTCVRPETRGFQFYSEGYLYDLWYCSSNSFCFMKSKCFRSQEKSNTPHSLWVCLPLKAADCEPLKAYCTCKAGASGFCNHIMALLYKIAHFSHYCKLGKKTIPDDVSKTSLPQVWDKPRIQGISAAPVMQVVVKKAKLEGSKSSKPVACSLYEARSNNNIANDSEVLSQVKSTLAKKNPLYGFSYMVTSDENMQTEYVKTSIDTFVPRGSVLSYQLALNEGDFDVVCSETLLDRFHCREGCIYPGSVTLPIFDISHPEFECDVNDDNVKVFLKSLNVNVDQCKEIELKTRGQSASDEWWEQRKYRLTASNFGELVKRKKKSCDKLVERKLQKVSTIKMPASLKHGRDYEDVAARKYMRYMKNIGHDVQVTDCGLVIRPDLPLLGASPDRLVYDPTAHPHIGMIEIKCPYSARGITPMQAAQSDLDFCCEVVGNNLALRRDHNYYYQVQGQMALSGTQWCDFVLYTFKGLSIERIRFDAQFWEVTKAKLLEFYLSHFVPGVLKVQAV